MSIRITVKGLNKARKELEKFDLTEIDRKLHDAVLELEGEIKQTAPVRTGRYRAAWASSRLGKLKYVISNNVEYAKYLIYGTSRMPVQHDVRGIIERWKGRLRRKLP
ncbi:HK97 gp10 family phage protein [Geoglobus ahangari]